MKNQRLHFKLIKQVLAVALAIALVFVFVPAVSVAEGETSVVLGDVNGDNEITVADYTLVRLHILGLRDLEGAFIAAGDVDGSGQVTISDYTAIRLHILDIKPLDGNVTPPPEPTPPPVTGSWYTIDNAQFGIDSSGDNARATTDGINEALNWAKAQGYNNIRFNEGTYLIQCNWNYRYAPPTDGILVPSDMTLDLGNSTFALEANSYPVYCIFGIVSQSNVTIMNGTLIGDRYDHDYSYVSGSSSHEWGFGICISASDNVLIQNVTISKMTGDGIILEGSFTSLASGGSLSNNVKVENCDISDCRRWGISVIGATNSELVGNTIYNIDGPNPAYGIDVEPEFDYVVTGLKIHGNNIFGCDGGAITCHSGSDYEVYDNTVTGNNILAVYSSNVQIYENTIIDTQIRVMPGASNIDVYDNDLYGNSWVFFG